MGNIVSSALSFLGAEKSANAQYDAAKASADAQLQAAKIAADAARFRPVGITNTFGTSAFGFDSQGNVNQAGYVLSPQLQAYQNMLAQQGGQAAQDVQGLLSLGRGYLGESPDAVRQRYMEQQNALLAPENEQTLAAIRNKLFQTGRGGLATGATTAGGMAATNPEMAAYYNALAKQQAALAAGAEQAAQQQVTFGQGLLSSAYSPLQTNLGVQQSIEALGQDPFVLGMNVGGKTAQAGGQAGTALLQGGLSAAKTLQGASGFSGTGNFLTGLSQNRGVQNALSNWFDSSPSSAVSNEVSSLGSSTWNPYSDYNTGANGWGNYGE